MFRHITLELSLKPFRNTGADSVFETATALARQWQPLLRGRESVSVMLWTADGSEILDYRGNADDPFSWCCMIGSANPPEHLAFDPRGISLHACPVYYTDHPPVMTYGILKEIVSALRRALQAAADPGTRVEIGETFDIGPEFAISDFKYKRHPEICRGMAMGARCFIDSSSVLHADDTPYAAWPDGIPEGTPFPVFFGKQCRVFLRDMGFDYIWLSNGVGFSATPWDNHGDIFDGERFHPESLAAVRERVLSFWQLFRAECPDLFIKTRGTNFSAGIDYATDGVPLAQLYREQPGMLPPPNSPWAALDGNFGLELMGHLSRNARHPAERWQFRYYIHDPWWMNSPWYDRYEGQPHDIYLPMALSRTDHTGKTETPTDLQLLSVDNSFGDLPDSCAREPLVHLLTAERHAPDAPPPLVWVYPFEEFCCGESEEELRRAFCHDWFMAQAINSGLPLGGVIDADDFVRCPREIFRESILLAPVPTAGAPYEEALLAAADAGIRVCLLGPLGRASDRIRRRFGITCSAKERTGLLILPDHCPADPVRSGEPPHRLMIRPLFCDGGLCEKYSGPDGTPCLTAEGMALSVQHGNLLWYRAPLGAESVPGEKYPVPDPADRFCNGGELLRLLLSHLGLTVLMEKPSPAVLPNTLTVHRSDNAWFFSVYAPSTTVECRLRFPQGAPLLIGYETCLTDGMSCYRFPRAEHRECRVFVDGMQSGLVGCRERTCESAVYRRRLEITGLTDATVTLYPETYCIGQLDVTLNSHYPFDTSDPLDAHWEDNRLILRHVTGTLSVRMPRTKPGRRKTGAVVYSRGKGKKT